MKNLDLNLVFLTSYREGLQTDSLTEMIHFYESKGNPVFKYELSEIGQSHINDKIKYGIVRNIALYYCEINELNLDHYFIPTEIISFSKSHILESKYYKIPENEFSEYNSPLLETIKNKDNTVSIGLSKNFIDFNNNIILNKVKDDNMGSNLLALLDQIY